MRHTTFKWALDPTSEQVSALSRHAGASRFAYNTNLRLVRAALAAKQGAGTDDPDAVAVKVAWTGFDLINQFNSWKKTEAAGRVFTVDSGGDADVVVTGLRWRSEVSAQVFEEASVDLGKALGAFSASKKGVRKGKRSGFPRFKKKGRSAESFRMRNKYPKTGRAPIRVGAAAAPRSVTLPGIGAVRVHDDTRKLRRMLAKGTAKILFATMTHAAGRWQISLNVEAADLHAGTRRDGATGSGWVGVDRGLHALAVAAGADGTEIGRFDHPKHAKTAMAKQRRLSRAVTRKTKGSTNRKKAAARLGRHHQQVRNRRHHWLHKVANTLIQYPQIALEDLNVAGMLANHHLAQSISDASWTELARIIAYKQAWRGGHVIIVDRWFPSSKTCSGCGHIRDLTLADRIYQCSECGLSIDRDLNAAINIATWAHAHTARDREATGPVTNARGQEGSDAHTSERETSLDETGTLNHAAA